MTFHLPGECPDGGRDRPADALRLAAEAVLRLEDRHRDASNGLGHPGEDHDRILGNILGEFGDTVGDCAACAGMMYGIEDEQNRAWGDLREALGQERKPWERR